jgi:F-type H+-transporting ATPase subunit epsilon
MERKFKIEIITPYRVFFKGEAEMIILNILDGELGVMADHEPIAAPVTIGAAQLLIDGTWKAAAFSDGFMEVGKNRVSVLVGAALWPEEIDVERAERSRQRAMERLQDTSIFWETNRAKAALKRAETRLKVAGKRKG